MKLVRHLAAVAAVLLATAGIADAKDWTKVRIGTEGAYPPFNFFDSNNELQGFDVDIARAVCEKMKVECEYVAQDWDGIIPALQAGKYDAIVASMSITDERKKVIDFSDKYYNTPSAFVAAKGSGITDISAAGLAGKTIGAQSSTIQSAYLEENYKGVNIKMYPTQDEVNLDLAAGRLDALLVDKLVALEWMEKTDDGKCCEFVGEDVPIGGGVGIGIRKEDQDLKAMLNKAIAEILADGTYEKINAKYFPFSIY